MIRVPGLTIDEQEIPVVALSTPRPPSIALSNPGGNDTQIMTPVPGPGGKDGKDGQDGQNGADGEIIGADGLTYRHDQNNPENPWVINHTLIQDVSACHIVSAGENIAAPWIATGPKQISIYFAGICSGYAILS